MKPERPDRILEDWASVARAARRPDAAPRPAVRSTALPLATLTGAAVLIALIALGGFVIGRPGPTQVAGVSPSVPGTSPDASAAVETASPAPSIGPAPGTCDVADVTARITSWDGAAGTEIASVMLTNDGSDACAIDTLARPQLVDANGVLIDGRAPTSNTWVTVAAGGSVTTEVAAGNYCGPAPVAPVSVAFVLADGQRIVAEPRNPTDATIPDCLGAQAAPTISMHPWAR